MGIPQGWELVLLLGVLVLLFGATKLPTAARSIGQSMRIFKAETKGMRSDDTAKNAEQPASPPQAQEQPEALPPVAQQATPADQPQGRHDTTR
ncbi:MAG: Sec-independent protein translocase subunit TatA [Actinomycetota bacterium]|nr:Sec-independent protein translocase subunit TatA [Actinomycetota bacterium]